jgi:valine dehydrogenase (NAD+)
LQAIIAIYSTALGPALGGTRFHPYASAGLALEDVRRLAEGMAYKAACAGLALGGGKAVIIGNPTTEKTDGVLRTYGRFVQSLAGRYITTCDVGTCVDDMDVIAGETRHVVGRSPERGGAGDSSILTALGVFQGMRAAAEYAWGEPTLCGRRVGVAGVGKVGLHLVDHLLNDGASLVVADPNSEAITRARDHYPQISVADHDDLIDHVLDVYAPCALGGVLSANTVRRLRAHIVCGGANNQLTESTLAKQLADQGILYVPDYVVNAGGLIQVAQEVFGYSGEEAVERTGAIFETTRQLLQRAEQEAVPPATAADRLAQQRIAAAASAAAIWLPDRGHVSVHVPSSQQGLAHLPPEGGALSPELRGPSQS